MAIDPKLYEKYSGRSGDPYARMGKALAQSSARASNLASRGGPATPEGKFMVKGWWWASIFLAIGVLVVLFSVMM
jgi:hypothetical protein